MIQKNRFLREPARGYYNCLYKGYEVENNPDFLNKLKNTFNSESIYTLNASKKEVAKRIAEDIPVIMSRYGLKACILVAIPRAKRFDTYTPQQMYFRDAVSDAAKSIPGVEDGSSCIIRHTNTRTTHLRENTGRWTPQGRVENNDGKLPYPGITKETCNIDESMIKGKNVILVEDIYTKYCNIDEDCIQALLDKGAKMVIFYAIAYTRRYE